MEKEGRRKGRERVGEREERGAAWALAVLTHLGEGLFPLDDVGATGLGTQQPGADVKMMFPHRPDERALSLTLGAQWLGQKKGQREISFSL